MLSTRSLSRGGRRQYGSMTPVARPTAIRQHRAGQIICCTRRSSPRCAARASASGRDEQISMPAPRLP
jgi:hypothetical protein